VSVAVLTKHLPEKPHPYLGKVLAVRDSSSNYGPDLKRLGFRYEKVSGKRADGGPGHRVAGVWVISLNRYQNDHLLQAQLDYLMLSANGATTHALQLADERVRMLSRAGEVQGSREQVQGRTA
jgi:hypothetical protein